MCIVSLLPRGSDGKESACQCRRPQFDSWVGKIPGRREWLLTPVFWPGEFCGQRSLEGCSSWSCKESNTTEWPILSRNSKVDFTNLFECKILFLGILLDPWSMEHTLRSTHLIQCRPQIAFTEIMEIQQGRCLPQPQVSGWDGAILWVTSPGQERAGLKCWAGGTPAAGPKTSAHHSQRSVWCLQSSTAASPASSSPPLGQGCLGLPCTAQFLHSYRWRSRWWWQSALGEGRGERGFRSRVSIGAWGEGGKKGFWGQQQWTYMLAYLLAKI